MELSFEKEKLGLDKLISDDFSALELLHYASAPRKIISEVIDTFFKNVILTKENNINGLITKVLKLLGYMRKKAEAFDRAKEKKKPQKAQKIGEFYKKAMRDIDLIANKLLGTKIQLSTEAKLYDNYKKNISREYSKLSAYISTLRKAIEIIRKQVSDLKDTSELSKEMSDIEKYKSRENMLRQMENKLYELEKSLLIALQTVCQLDIMSMNNASLCEQMQTIIFEGMSVFKNNIIITIGNRESKAAIEMIMSVIEGAKSIKVAQEKYEGSRTQSKGQKIESLTDLAKIENEIARLQGSVAIS